MLKLLRKGQQQRKVINNYQARRCWDFGDIYNMKINSGNVLNRKMRNSTLLTINNN